MKRNYPVDAIIPVIDQDLLKQVVFHEAGHAAAIHLYNRKKQLPPVYFQITIKQADCFRANSFMKRVATRNNFVAIVEGGCLIHSLPMTLIENELDEQDAFRTAYEADMINMLVGPLAEAKYVALRDDECFNKNLISINALHNYGGTSDLEKVYDYLENFVVNTGLHEERTNDLFNQAFQFVESPIYWQAIEKLSGYILENMKNTISCEEVMVVLDETIIDSKS